MATELLVVDGLAQAAGIALVALAFALPEKRWAPPFQLAVTPHVGSNAAFVIATGAF